MYSKKPNRFSIDYYRIQQEIVYTPEEKQKEEPKEEPKKVLQKMSNPEPEDRLEKDSQKIEKEKPKEEQKKVGNKNQKEHKDINSFETLKNKFLNVKNKSLFIKRNRDKIKSLISDEQKQFIQMARSHFNSV